MTENYNLQIDFTENIDINEIISFFIKNGFTYVLKWGYSDGLGRFNEKISLVEAIKEINSNGGTIVMDDKNIQISLFYSKSSHYLSLSIGFYGLNSHCKIILQHFIQFVKEKYKAFKKIEEYSGFKRENYPFIFNVDSKN
jgi:hypothetical protein